MDFNFAPDILRRVRSLVEDIGLNHILKDDLFCFRSCGSKSRAYARIWSLPRIWQKALNVKPHYIIEVISEKFEKLNADDQNKVLLHELLHIPKNFSGSLLPHKSRGRRIDRKTVEKLFNQHYLKNL